MKLKEKQESKLRPFIDWLNELGRSPITGWRWRQRGWIKTISIAGRQYISGEAIAEFTRRAEAGEFRSVGAASKKVVD